MEPEDQESESEQPHMHIVRLDGTFGAGADAELTIITKTPDGGRRETQYTVPYLCLDMKRIQGMCDLNLMLGFKIVKSDGKIAGLRELGL